MGMTFHEILISLLIGMLKFHDSSFHPGIKYWVVFDPLQKGEPPGELTEDHLLR